MIFTGFSLKSGGALAPLPPLTIQSVGGKFGVNCIQGKEVEVQVKVE